MFEPRHNILSNVRTNVRKYDVTWLEHSRECNRPVVGPLLAELSIIALSGGGGEDTDIIRRRGH